MKRRALLASALAVAFPGSFGARAAGNLVRIGWVTAQQATSLAPFVDAFRKSLAELGYVEGRDLEIEFRYGNDAIERVPDLVAELVGRHVQVIVAQGAAVSVINTLKLDVPVAYVFSGDPISAGFAESLARPHVNMTGLSFMAPELNGKRLELLQEFLPNMRRVAIIANPEHPGEQLERGYSEVAAKRLHVAIDYYPTRSRDELAAAFKAIVAAPVQAISVFADGFAIQNRQSIVDFAMSQRTPVISGWAVFARSGAICTYGPRLIESYRRLAYYVDRMIKGAKPDELPIEQPTKFEFVVNLKTARALGIAMPESLVVRADEVID